MEVAINTSTSGDNTLVAAVADRAYRVRQMFLIPASAVTVQFKSGSNALTGPMSLAANQPFVLGAELFGWMTSNRNEALIINLGGAVQVSGRMVYDRVDV